MNREHGLRARARLVRGVVAVALATAISPLAMAPLTAHAAPLAYGDLLVSGPGGRIYHFDPHGTLLNVMDTQTENTSNAPSREAAVCFDAGLDVFSTNYDAGSMTEFNLQGNIVANPWAGSFNTNPQSCVRDSAGNTYIGSANPGGLTKLSPTSTLLATYSPTSQGGGVVGIDLAPDGCTIYYTSASSSILRYDACTSTQLSDFVDNITTVCDTVKIRSGGDVLVACAVVGAGGGVYHYDSAGHLLQFYSAASFNQTAPSALALDPDGTSFWVGDGDTGSVDKVDIETGRVLTQLQTGIALNNMAIVPGPKQAEPPVATSLSALQDELVVCGNAPVSGMPSASSTPCVRTLSGAAVQPATSQLGQTPTVTGAANVEQSSGAVTVAGRGAPPNETLQAQFVPAGSTASCGSLFWSASSPPPSGGLVLGTMTADGNGNYASTGALTLPSSTPLGQAQVCVVQPAPPGTSTPTAQQTVPVTIVSGTGPNTCLLSGTGHATSTAGAGDGAWWNGDTGAVGGSTGGVYARISNYNPSVAPIVGDVTASTVIYAPPSISSPGAVQMAQTGWTKGDLHFPPGTPPQQFAEYVDTNVNLDVFFSGVSGAVLPTGTTQQAGALGTAVTGDSDYYATTFDPTTQLTNALNLPAPGQFNFYVNNTLVASMPGTFTPRDTRVGTWVHAGTDQIAGGVNDPEHFSDVYAYEPAGPAPSGSTTERWLSFDQQAVTPVVTAPVSTYAQMTAANPAAGATVDTWDSTCSM